MDKRQNSDDRSRLVEKEKEKKESLWKKVTDQFSTNTKSMPKNDGYKKL